MSLLDSIRKRDTPAKLFMYRTLKRMIKMRFPVIPGLHHLLLLERKFRSNMGRYAWSKIYREPLFRMQVSAIGKDFTLHETMPKILGPLKIYIGDRVAFSGEQTWMAGGPRELHEIRIDDDSYIGHACCLISGSLIHIGKHVRIANRVILNGYDGHPLDPFARARDEPPDMTRNDAIRVGDYAWIGNDVTVLRGISIGKGAVVAAGSIVTKDVPDLAVVAGNPARVIRLIDPPEGWPTLPAA